MDDEVQVVDHGIMSRCYSRYRNIFGCFPPEGQEATQIQISAIHALLDRGLAPYADFAVWVPYANRCTSACRTSVHPALKPGKQVTPFLRRLLLCSMQSRLESSNNTILC
eukprot:5403824-Amphidinium_carterae.1